MLALRIRKDGGPAFYSQIRIGKDGKPFKCWKFRSMIVNADEALKLYLASNPDAEEEYKRDFKLKDDPRITPVGRLLRKTSLDEIPQFYNVLKGEMSLVGPRPIVEKETHFYEDKLSYYLAVRPGITGLWQVSGRNDISYQQRVSMDVWYVENWSIWNDIVIFIETVYVVLARKGAY
jgi:undecaprenyl-phosphate galactose phosphotransferase